MINNDWKWKDLKKAWVKALRSGEYKQCTGELHGYKVKTDNLDDDVGYCCLGVLSCIIGAEVDGPGNEICFETPEGEYYESGEIPIQVMKYLGIPHHVNQYKLAKMNDGSSEDSIRQHSFEQIADYIEENY